MKTMVRCGHARLFKGRMITCKRYKYYTDDMCSICLGKKIEWHGNRTRYYPNKWNPKTILDLSI